MLAEEFTLEDLFVAKVKGAIEKGRVELLREELQDGVIDIQTAAKYLNVSVKEAKKLLQAVEWGVTMLAEEFTLEDLFVAKVKGAIRTGQEKGREELLRKELQDGVIDIQTAAKYLNVSVKEAEELLQVAEWGVIMEKAIITGIKETIKKEKTDILLDYVQDGKITMFVAAQHLNVSIKEVEKLNLEGIVAKRIDSNYLINTRTDNWLKIKNFKKDYFYIGGYEENKSSYTISLLLGEYHDKNAKEGDREKSRKKRKKERNLIAYTFMGPVWTDMADIERIAKRSNSSIEETMKRYQVVEIEEEKRDAVKQAMEGQFVLEDIIKAREEEARIVGMQEGLMDSVKLRINIAIMRAFIELVQENVLDKQVVEEYLNMSIE